MDLDSLRAEADKALSEKRPADVVCYLAEIVAAVPDDRRSRVALAIALGDAGYPAGALKVLRGAANNLANKGFLLPAMIVVRHGMEHAPDDVSLVTTLKRLHVRGVRAKAGNLPVPPPLKIKKEPSGIISASSLLELTGQMRLEKATEVGLSFPSVTPAAPVPLPLFSELDENAFVEIVKQLHYRRAPDGSKFIKEGEVGNTLLIIAEGNVRIERGKQVLAKIGAGSVLGEMALITGSPRSATAIAEGEVELFELSRADVEKLAALKPEIAEELIEYCRKRLIANLLRTSSLFSRFDDDTRFNLLQRFQRQGFQSGVQIIVQGQPGRGLYVLATGEVEISVAKDGGSQVVVAKLGPGDVFGEISLLYDQPTNATVTTSGRVGALFLPRDDFQNVLNEHPEVREYLQGLSADRIKASSVVHEEQEIMDADDIIVL